VRLRVDWLLAGAVAVAASLAPLDGRSQPASPVVTGEAPTRDEVRRALDAVAEDPNLAAERKVSMLRFKEAEPVTDEPWWWRWVNGFARWARGLFAWIAESGRLVVYVALAIAAALLALYIARLVSKRGLPRVPSAPAAPSHVRDLDIRPESLPDDIGAEALALWERGEERAALALLYRGLLSRLVHEHAVPIRSSSTEGECLALARPRLPEASARFAAALIETWAAAVYGGVAPTAGAVRALCTEFGVALDGKEAAA
jgi:hypothetical protein